MPKYKYLAQDTEGKKVRGTLRADDETQLYSALREKNLFLEKAKLEERPGSGTKLKPRDLSEFSRQLGTLIGSGVSLVRALSIIAQDQNLKPSQAAVYNHVLTEIRKGVSLSDAMEAQNGSFPSLLINMYRSAETAGNLDRTALRMASHYDKEHRLNTKVKNAMLYPKILCVLIVAVVFIIFGFVMPMFGDLFEGMELPWYTRVVMWLTDFVQNQWVGIIIGIICLIILFKAIFTIPQVELWKDKLKLRIPVMGKLWKIIYTARFARTLSSLYSAGLPIVTALTVSQSTIGNKYIESQFEQAIAVVRRGDNLSDAIQGIDGFINKLSTSVMIGEETGSLDAMLETIADSLDYESEMATARLTTLMEPVMIVVMAVVVGFIMMSVMVPIFQSYGAVEATGGMY